VINVSVEIDFGIKFYDISEDMALNVKNTKKTVKATDFSVWAAANVAGLRV
jgi:hypothetical protein